MDGLGFEERGKRGSSVFCRRKTTKTLDSRLRGNDDNCGFEALRV
jgi:hypothetical protein